MWRLLPFTAQVCWGPISPPFRGCRLLSDVQGRTLAACRQHEVRELGEQQLFAGAAIDGLKARRAGRRLGARSPVPVRRRGGTTASSGSILGSAIFIDQFRA